MRLIYARVSRFSSAPFKYLQARISFCLRSGSGSDVESSRRARTSTRISLPSGNACTPTRRIVRRLYAVTQDIIIISATCARARPTRRSITPLCIETIALVRRVENVQPVVRVRLAEDYSLSGKWRRRRNDESQKPDRSRRTPDDPDAHRKTDRFSS